MPDSDVLSLRELSLDDVIPTPDNNRHIDPRSPDIRELAQSIASLGVLQPVVVRPHPQQPGKWDLRAGARRYHASLLAEKVTIPAVVRELSDREAMAITVCENAQREDLTPLEEARGVQLMLDAGFTAEETAHEMGKEVRWIHRRAALTQLTEAWKTAFGTMPSDDQEYQDHGQGPAYGRWTLAEMEEVARLPGETQDKLMAWALRSVYRERPGLYALQYAIGDLTRELKRAPFDLSDEGLVKGAGTCEACQKRQGGHPQLFEIEPREAKQDICLDGQCYERKVKAHVRRVIAGEKAKDPNTVEVTAASSWEVPEKARKKAKLDYGSSCYRTPDGYYVKAKKGAAGAVPAVVRSGDERGKRLFLVKLTERKAGTQREESYSPWMEPKTVGQGRTQLEDKRGRMAQEIWQKRVETLTRPVELDVAGLLQMILVAGGCDCRPDDRRSVSVGKVREQVHALAPDQVLDAVWQGMVTQAARGYGYAHDPRAEKDRNAIGDLLGVTWQSCVEEAAKTLPEPKAWAGLKDEDPIPEAAAKPKAAQKAKRARKGKAVEPKADPGAVTDGGKPEGTEEENPNRAITDQEEARNE